MFRLGIPDLIGKSTGAVHPRADDDRFTAVAIRALGFSVMGQGEEKGLPTAEMSHPQRRLSADSRSYWV
ncbi:hypothetical protein AB4Y72_14930 [Arthrobacter sp. YAF34]|uniref:hypothetical protein n=1 Tax=Arthrobacter sp. YAF34 TaxID=3233083 RepID=UPI003F8F67BB